MERELMVEGRITEEGLEELRRRKGKKLRISGVNNQLASKETIRNFVYGVGDGNPLWLDEQYCKGTRYGILVAPPSWLYSVFGVGVMHGLPGVHAFHAGDDWEFYKPVLLGDTIRPEAIAMGFEEKSSHFAQRTILDYQERRYYNQRDELVAKALKWTIRAEKKAARETKRYDIQLPHPWTDEQLKKLEDEILSREKRGSRVRYWEDVAVGDQLDPLIKGPLSMVDEIAFIAGTHMSNIPANEIALQSYRRHPAWSFRNPDTCALEPLNSVHWNFHAARHAGLPYPYDMGMQRNSWLIQLLSDWMGDEGWLKRCYAEYKRFVFLSDVIWLRGKITRKFIDDEGECCVEIETSAFNQRGEDTMPGRATVILPSRDRQSWPVEKRLPVHG